MWRGPRYSSVDTVKLEKKKIWAMFLQKLQKILFLMK